MRHRLAAVTLGALLLVVAAGAAAFGLTVDTTTPAPGSTVTVSGDCGVPGLQLTISIVPPGTVLGTTTTGADGTFSLKVTIPANQPDGAAQIVAADPTNQCVSNADIYPPTRGNLVANVTVSKSALAFTGSNNTGTYVAVGAVLVLIGAVLTVATVRRHRAPTGGA
jgi:hypothetical protein